MLRLINCNVVFECLSFIFKGITETIKSKIVLIIKFKLLQKNLVF